MAPEGKDQYRTLDQSRDTQQQQQLLLLLQVVPSNTLCGLGGCDFPSAPDHLRPVATGSVAQTSQAGDSPVMFSSSLWAYGLCCEW